LLAGFYKRECAMALTRCPECDQEISDQALMCPHCGLSMRAKTLYGYEYRSRATLWGLPLVHVATGVDSLTGRRRVARGIIAIGERAVGVLAIGGGAIGAIAIGGGAIGIIALGGAAIGGLLALGGAAIGAVALGGAAIGAVAVGGGAFGYYAFGGGAGGVHPLGGNIQDPEAAAFFRQWLGSWWINGCGDRKRRGVIVLSPNDA
jgi:zinc-ribbon domain